MAHFDTVDPLRTRRTQQYDSFAVLTTLPNCTHEKQAYLTTSGKD